MDTDGFFWMDEYLTRFSMLTIEEIGKLARACMKYHITGEVPNLEGQLAEAFNYIRADIDSEENKREVRRLLRRLDRMERRDQRLRLQQKRIQ